MNTLTKNFLFGVGSILSIFPSTQARNVSDLSFDAGMKSDAEKLAGDWAMIGKDMHAAIKGIETLDEQKNKAT